MIEKPRSPILDQRVSTLETDFAPLYRALKERVPGVLGTEAIKWNFTKFLVSRDGTTIKRFAPMVEPADLGADIEAMLGA